MHEIPREPRRPANGVGAEPWQQPRLSRPPVVAGEVSTGVATVLRMPLRKRIAARWNEMVRQTAERFHAKSTGRWSWVPLASLIVSVALSGGAIAMAAGVWRGRAEVKQETVKDNQAATAALVSASEARLIRAADEMKQGVREMRQELLSQVASINDKVESIRGSVSDFKAEQRGEVAGLRAELRAAQEDKARLWQMLETYNLKLERIERQQRGVQPSPNGGH